MTRNMNIECCPISNRRLFIKPKFSVKQNVAIIETRVTGKYSISEYAFDIIGDYKEKHFVLAGYCRDKNENNETTPLITTELLDNLDNHKYPKDYKSKRYSLLKYIFNKSGGERIFFNLRSTHDYSICYSHDIFEFNRLITDLFEASKIDYSAEDKDSNGDVFYRSVVITDKGEESILKSNPNFVLQDLIKQDISVGNEREDEMLNTARKRFFNPDATFEDKRSACEILIKILEPKRKLLENKLGKMDTNTFFSLVNNFDIRHNKPDTMKIEHEEQFEWLFYSFLNTINFYIKIQKKKQNEISRNKN